MTALPKFKTSTFTRLWNRYKELDQSLTNRKSLLRSFTFPLLVNPVSDDNFHVLSKNNQNFLLSASKRQTWSMFKSFRKLFSVPIVHCESRNIPEESRDSVSGADVLEKNFNNRRQQALVNPSAGLTEIDIIKYIDNQTGMDRLKAVFERNLRGEQSAELQRFSSQLTGMIMTIFFITMVFGGAKGREEFIRKNKATVFLTKGIATRQLMDAIFIESLKGGFYWTLRFGFFATVMLTVSEAVAIYRNKTSPMEYTAAGAVAGSIIKSNLGPKGMVSGGVIGSLIGLVLGLGITQVARYVEDTQEHRHFKNIQTQLLEDIELRGSLKKSPVSEDDSNEDYEID